MSRVRSTLVREETAGGAETGYAYNGLGELVQVDLSDGTVVGYFYDGLGRRIGKTVDGELVAGYLWSGRRLVGVLNGSGALEETFVWGTRGNVPDEMVANGETYRIIADAEGSVRLVVNAGTGEVKEELSYSPWGRVIRDTDPGFQPFGYAGGLYDPETGLERFGVRDYDPATGRWIEPDPILFAGGGTNLYAYAGENPVNFVDLTGLYPYSLFQLAAIVYNETASLSGSGINAARLDIAYVALNRPQPGGVAPDKFTPSAISAIVGRDPPALAAYISSWMAAWCASSYPQYDPTHGAQYFNLRPDKSSKPFEGEPLLIQNGPFNNSVPSKLLPSSGIYVNVYGRP